MSKRFSFLMLLLFCLISCGEEVEPQAPPIPQVPSGEKLALEKLTGTSGITYSMGNNGYIKRNQTDESKFYSNFSLRFIGSSKSYTSTGASDLFESSGTWEFVGSNFDKIKLSGSKPGSQVDISYTKNGQDLILVFSVPSPPGGRVTALAGSYEIKVAGG